jgi:CRISPR/Cas system CSM-associated protein Csm3 (group 7 of RAMP superfamily)
MVHGNHNQGGGGQGGAQRPSEAAWGANHPPNPFWFVPTHGDTAACLPLEKWGVYDPKTRRVPAAAQAGSPRELLTGRVVMTLTTITPLHVAGKIEASPGPQMKMRHFYRRKRIGADGEPEELPVIEGSSVRGTVRAYIEALTNGVASSYTVGFEHSSRDPKRGPYAKQFNSRHLGFWVGPAPGTKEGGNSRERREAFASTFSVGGGTRHVFGSAGGRDVIDGGAHLWVPPKLGDRLGTDLAPTGADLHPVAADAATLMFGLVTLDAETKTEPDKKEDKARPAPVHALRGRVRFGDVWFRGADLEISQEGSLDLPTAAGMGGPKPSRSTWWYFPPAEVRLRRVRQGAFVTAEFVGARSYRGRKFYFHQDPTRCIRWYRSNWGHQSLRTVPTERVKGGTTSSEFVVEFENLPRCLVELLLVALRPSCGVRHKLGGLKPFGYGSVEFNVNRVELERRGPESLDLSASRWRTDQSLTVLAQGTDTTKYPNFAKQQEGREMALKDAEGNWLASMSAWSLLRTIAYCPKPQAMESEPRLFAYPVFFSPPRGVQAHPLERGFAYPFSERDLQTVGVPPGRVTAESASNIAKQIGQRHKRTIDIDYYQGSANGWAALVAEAGDNTASAR